MKSCQTKKSNFSASFWLYWFVIAKFGGKFIPAVMKVLPKILKGTVGLKGLGITASLGFYSFLFSWQMAISLVAFLLIHEYGHLWAMKRCKIETKGIYLIPGFGAVAVAKEKFKNARDEVFIAIMGPLAGLLFIIPVIVLYFWTNELLFAAIASVMAIINLFNLFPINPLDGGRVAKGLFYSINGSLCFFFSIFSFVLAVIFSFYTDFILLGFIALIGLFEIFDMFMLEKVLVKTQKTFYRAFGLVCLWFIITKAFLLNIVGIIIGGIIVLMIMLLFLTDIYKTKEERSAPWYYYFLIILQDLFAVPKELFSIKPSYFKRIKDYCPMDKGRLRVYASFYLLTVGIMLTLIIYIGNILGLQEVKQVLM